MLKKSRLDVVPLLLKKMIKHLIEKSIYSSTVYSGYLLNWLTELNLHRFSIFTDFERIQFFGQNQIHKFRKKIK